MLLPAAVKDRVCNMRLLNLSVSTLLKLLENIPHRYGQFWADCPAWPRIWRNAQYQNNPNIFSVKLCGSSKFLNYYEKFAPAFYNTITTICFHIFTSYIFVIIRLNDWNISNQNKRMLFIFIKIAFFSKLLESIYICF